MSEARAPHWLELFCDALSCGPSFRRSLDATLGAAFAARVGSGLEGFMLVPPEGGAADITVDRSGVASVSTDLVGPDAFGHPVTVAWQAAGIARPLPTGPAIESASAAGLLMAWWAALPDDELRRAYGPSGQSQRGNSNDARFETGSYPFEVEWRPFPWPDLWLQVRLRGVAAAVALPTLVQHLRAVQDRWNRQDGPDAASGRIHQVGSQAAVLAADLLVLNVDFGSAPPAALVATLRAMSELTDRLPVSRVTIGSALLANTPAK